MGMRETAPKNGLLTSYCFCGTAGHAGGVIELLGGVRWLLAEEGPTEKRKRYSCKVEYWI